MALRGRAEVGEELAEVGDLGCSSAARAATGPASGAASSSAYSFIAEPQPAELTMIASTSACSKVSISWRANVAASARLPSCSDSAPQQPCPAGTMTSHPSLASTRAVAALT